MTHEYGRIPVAISFNGQSLLSANHFRGEDSWEPSEPEPIATLWRYMSLAKFCSLLDRKALFFSLVGDMEDRYEGFIYPPMPREEDHLQQVERLSHEMVREIIRTALISCWAESNHESSLMWEHYAGKEGVAVRTTFKDLRDSIRPVAERPITFGQVEYVDYSQKEVPRLGRAPLFHKRMEYRGENEVRGMLPGPRWDPDEKAIPRLGIPKNFIPLDPDVAEQRGRYIPVNLNILVKEVVLPPYATPWFAEVVESIIHGSSIRPRIIRSAIESPPHTLKRGV